jgi:hypothetical protein
VFVLFALAFAVAWLAHRAIVPVFDGDGQVNWQVQAAFVLLAIQYIGMGGTVLVVIAGALNRLQRLWTSG